MTIGTFCATRTNENIADAVTSVKFILAECDHVCVACVAKLHLELRLLDLFAPHGLQTFGESRYSFEHGVVVRTGQIMLFELGTPVALLVKVKVASVHAGEVALAQHDRPFAQFAGDVLSHVKIAVATFAWLGQCSVAHRVPLVTLFGFRR